MIVGVTYRSKLRFGSNFFIIRNQTLMCSLICSQIRWIYYNLWLYSTVLGNKRDIFRINQILKLFLRLLSFNRIKVRFKFLKYIEYLFKLFNAFLDAKLSSLRRNFKVECERSYVKHIFSQLITEDSQVFKHVMLFWNLTMPLKMVCHLGEKVEP